MITRKYLPNFLIPAAIGLLLALSFAALPQVGGGVPKLQTTSAVTLTATSGCTTTPTTVANFTKTGNVVTFEFVNLTCTSNSIAGLVLSGIPAAYQPSGRGSGQNATYQVPFTDAGTIKPSYISVCPKTLGCSPGTAQVFPQTGSYTGAGTAFFVGQVITYTLD